MNASTVVLTTVSDALIAFKEFTGDMDVQVQAIQTFLLIATRDSLSLQDIAKLIGLNQSTATRNVKKLAVGPSQQDGYGLITVELDLHDQRRRIHKLSARGHELVRFLEERTAPSLTYHFAKTFGVKQS